MQDPQLKLDNFICFAVYTATHALNRVYKPLLEALGLTYPQYLAMVSLWQDRTARPSAASAKSSSWNRAR